MCNINWFMHFDITEKTCVEDKLVLKNIGKNRTAELYL